MLEQLMTRRKLILWLQFPPFFPAVLCSPLIVIAISPSPMTTQKDQKSSEPQ